MKQVAAECAFGFLPARRLYAVMRVLTFPQKRFGRRSSLATLMLGLSSGMLGIRPEAREQACRVSTVEPAAWVSALVFGIAAIALWAQLALSLIFGSPQVSIQALVAAGACTMTGLAAALTVGAVLGLRRVDQSGPPPDARVRRGQLVAAGRGHRIDRHRGGFNLQHLTGDIGLAGALGGILRRRLHPWLGFCIADSGSFSRS